MRFTMYPTVMEQPKRELEDAGHRWVDSLDEAELLVYTAVSTFPELPSSVRYVQVAYAGMDSLREQGVLTDKVRWANAAGLYADTVAESTIAMLLAVAHKYPAIVDAKSWWVRSLPDRHTNWVYDNKTLAIIGAGGIAKRLLTMISGFGLHTIAVNTSGNPVEGADETLSIDRVDEVWPRADYVVLLAPLTEFTEGMIDAEVLRAMRSDTILINVGRGKLVVTKDLVEALEAGEIGGAALDVTDPEPLPDGHPLWRMDNVLITPHVANTSERMQRLLGGLFVRNAAAFEAGERMPTEVDPGAGY